MECTELLRVLGERVRAIRKSQKLSQEKLAELASLHPVFISNVETGRRRASICTYHSIAEALGLTLSELVDIPSDKESWDSNLLVLFQTAKSLDKDKQNVFVETVKGVLNGLGEIEHTS